MKQSNSNKLFTLLELLQKDKNVIIYGDVPGPCKDYIGEAAQLKRNKQYDESLEKYFAAIQLGYFTTEMGRMMAKTICAMNEYTAAFWMLLMCADVKWKDTLKPNPLYQSAGVDLDFLKQSELPTACANDFYLLRDAIYEASKGNLKPLFDRTKEVSGQNDYQNIKTDSQIQSECKMLADACHFNENLN